jgi:hypothetical protein
MTNLALALAAALVIGSGSIVFAGEGSPDIAVPSIIKSQRTRMVAPVASRLPLHGATVAPSDAAERSRLERASPGANY